MDLDSQTLLTAFCKLPCLSAVSLSPIKWAGKHLRHTHTHCERGDTTLEDGGIGLMSYLQPPLPVQSTAQDDAHFVIIWVTHNLALKIKLQYTRRRRRWWESSRACFLFFYAITRGLARLWGFSFQRLSPDTCTVCRKYNVTKASYLRVVEKRKTINITDEGQFKESLNKSSLNSSRD